MVKGSIPYRDTIAAPGSQLHRAITDGNLKEADRIYKDTTQRMLVLMNPKEKFEDVPF